MWHHVYNFTEIQPSFLMFVPNSEVEYEDESVYKPETIKPKLFEKVRKRLNPDIFNVCTYSLLC